MLKLPAIISAFAIFTLQGCGEPAAVSASDCDKVVAHAKQVMGKFAPSDKEMLTQCKAATDQVRGCVMEADKPMKLSQCDF